MIDITRKYNLVAQKNQRSILHDGLISFARKNIELSISTFVSVSKTSLIKLIHETYDLCVIFLNRWLIYQLLIWTYYVHELYRQLKMYNEKKDIAYITKNI